MQFSAEMQFIQTHSHDKYNIYIYLSYLIYLFKYFIHTVNKGKRIELQFLISSYGGV